MREHLTPQNVNAYLDTPAGVMLCAAHGGRQAAASAMVEAERADRAWRRERAAERAERYPDRYPSVDDAMNAIGDPVGGGGASLAGDVDEIVKAVRWADPVMGRMFRNLGEDLPDTAPRVTDESGRPADTRPPWKR